MGGTNKFSIAAKLTSDIGDFKQGMKQGAESTRPLSNSLEGLREKQERLEKSMSGLDVSSKKFKALAREIASVNSQLKNADLSMEGLDTEGKASELKSVVGGMGDMATAAGALDAAFGGANLEEFIIQVETIERVAIGVSGGIESVQSGIKLLNSSTALNTFLESANLKVKKDVLLVDASSAIVDAKQVAMDAKRNSLVAANTIALAAKVKIQELLTVKENELLDLAKNATAENGFNTTSIATNTAAQASLNKQLSIKQSTVGKNVLKLRALTATSAKNTTTTTIDTAATKANTRAMLLSRAAMGGAVLIAAGLAYGIYKVYQSYSDSTKAAKEFSEELKTANDSISAEVGELMTLREALKDVNLTKQERIDIGERVAEIAGIEYNRELDVSKAIEKQVIALKAKAKIVALNESIGKATKRAFDETLEQQEKLDRLEGYSGIKVSRQGIPLGDWDYDKKVIKERMAKIKSLSEKEISKLYAVFKNMGGIFEFDETETDEANEKLKKKLSVDFTVLEPINEEMTAAEIQKAIDSMFRQALNAVKEGNKKLSDEAKNNLDIALSFNPELAQKQSDITADIDALIKEYIKLHQAGRTAKADAMLLKIKAKVEIETDMLDAEKTLQQLKDGINSASKDIFAGLGASIGEALGEALAGGNISIKTAVGSIVGLIGDSLKVLGKALVAFATTKIVAESALKGANPYVALAAGVAAIAAGAALSSLIGGSGGVSGGGSSLAMSPAGLKGDASVSMINAGEIASATGSAGMGQITQKIELSGTLTAKGSDLQVVLDKNNIKKSRF